MTHLNCLICGNSFYTSDNEARRRKTCSLACRGVLSSRSHHLKRTGPFESYVSMSEEGCWEWQGFRNAQGYGEYRHKKAHRVSWELANGQIPDGLYVCHKCDNPSCVRPDHLFLGTAKDNVHDMITKGRAHFIGSDGREPSGFVGKNKGEQHRSAKLTESQVITIRSRFVSRCPINGAAALAAEYGVGQDSIRRIVRRDKWRHI